MSIVNILEINILNNPARFEQPYVFKITFECTRELPEDIEWKLIYVGSAENESFDQELDTCMVGPVPLGVNSFEFEAAAPTPDRIPASDLIGVTVVLLTGSYLDQEFVRIGYYVHTEYDSEELRALEEHDRPNPPLVDRLSRNVLSEKPRVTRFNINWDKDGEQR